MTRAILLRLIAAIEPVEGPPISEFEVDVSVKLREPQALGHIKPLELDVLSGWLAPSLLREVVEPHAESDYPARIILISLDV
jgi:hypothetical protein